MGARVRAIFKYACVIVVMLNARNVIANPVNFSIPAEEAESALTEFGKQAHQQVLFESAKLKGIRTNALYGNFEPLDALMLMLKGTGLTAVVREGNVVVIEAGQNPATQAGGKTGSSRQERRRQPVVAESLATPSSEGALQEVVVTAEKRQSTVQSTPISITAISGAQLEARGMTDLISVTKDTPGISFRTAGPGQTEFEMRGVSSTGGSVGTVGFYLDETPFTPPSFGAIGKVVIDPTLYDLQSVEVLRGPQGTLYGAGSMGGTIRVLTRQPEVNGFDASADVTGSGTQGGGFNRSGDLMLNFPLVKDLMALRLVASSEFRDGWLDRIIVNPFPEPTNSGCEPQPGWAGCARGDVTASAPSQVRHRVNWERLNTFRPSLLLKPSDQLSITLSAMYQRTFMGGYDNFDIPPGCGSGILCGHYQPFDDKEPFSDIVKLLSGVIHYDTPIASITSATSYWTRNELQTQDAAEALESALGPPFVSAPLTEIDTSKQFSEELRATSNTQGRFQWLVGVFYSDFKFLWYQDWYNDAFATPTNPQGDLYVATIPSDTKQYSAFTEESYKITPTLKFTAGVRAFRYQTAANFVYDGLLTPSGDASKFYGFDETSKHGLNPKFNLSYTPTHDLTLYGTASKGFRPGGISEAFPDSCLPGLQALGLTAESAATYGPDSLWDYEAGEKARLLNGRLSINSDVYYIRWSGIQQVVPMTCGYILEQNAGNARSYGPELEVQGKITRSLTASLSAAYTNAYIAEPKFGLPVGQPLLNVPKYTASLALDYTRALSDDLILTGYVSESVVGPEWDIAYAQSELPSYALTDARVGLNRGHWTATLFVTNLTNRQAIQTINNTFFTLNIPSLTRATLNQPRTIGLKIGWQFR